MSEFPDREHFIQSVSDAVRRKLGAAGFPDASGPVVRKAKEQYLYDLDGNKYCDFDLCHGTVLLGHAQKTVTQFVKAGLSAGMAPGLPNKFHGRLVNLFRGFCPDAKTSFFGHFDSAASRLLESSKARSVGVTSSYLVERLRPFASGVSVEKIRPGAPGARGASYDIVFYEPVDFDGNLERLNSPDVRAKTLCAVEDRTFFRFGTGFLSTLRDAHHILCANSCANGMDACVVLSRSALPGELISVHQSVAVLETVKAYGRKINSGRLDVKRFRPDDKVFSAWNGSAFKLKKRIAAEKLLRKGVFLDGDLGFVCLAHTGNDWNRLTAALSELL